MKVEMVKRVAYIHDSSLVSHCDSLPAIRHRASLTHALISAYNLLPKMTIVPSIIATEDDIRQFHSSDYVEMLKNNLGKESEEEEDEFGLGYDCPLIENLWPVVQRIAGASIMAAQLLVAGEADVAINWCGGWHHAQRDSASGFCYINDIVLAIDRLRTKFDRVLYIDLDVHHGDGVENAFQFSHKVFTLSLHRLEAGYFPGTGECRDVGQGKGKFYSVNVPFRSGINNQQFTYLFESLLYPICEVFLPLAIVCQCGADGLAGDPLGGANLTLEALMSSTRLVLSLNKPTLFLGGGGYKLENAARLWTALTGVIVDVELSQEIPDHEFFLSYKPSYELPVTASLIKSENTQAMLDMTIRNILGHVECLGKEVPSSQSNIGFPAPVYGKKLRRS